jgi:hypothetical protein
LIVYIDIDSEPLDNLTVLVPQGFRAVQMPPVNAVRSSYSNLSLIGDALQKCPLKSSGVVILFIGVNGLKPFPVLNLL